MYTMWFCIQEITLKFGEYAEHHLHDKYVYSPNTSFFSL